MKGKLNMKKNLLTLDLQHFADEIENAGENEVEESATPQEEETEEDPSETAEENGDGEPHEQSAEENARYAAIRRKAEEDAHRKYEPALGQLNQINQEIAALCNGVTHPMTGQPITNALEYFDALRIQQRQEQERELQEKGIDPSTIDKMVQSNPAVLQANRVMAQMEEQRMLNQVQRDVEEISKLDPNVKNAEDLYNAPYCQAIISYAKQHGTTLTDAFKILNYDSHLASRDDATRQQAINQMRGKEHLASQPTGVATENDDVEVPAEIMKSWKAEGRKEKDIRAIYKKVAGQLGLN